MYYYIMEPPKNLRIRRLQQKIKDILGDLGIAGETVLPSPARTVEELCEVGIAKGYSTIVAVGSEKHINKVVSAILEGEVVLGIIPTDESAKIYQIIGTSSLRESCQALKFRKLASLDVGEIVPSKYFITQAEIHQTPPFNLKVEFKQFMIETQVTDLILTSAMKLFLKNTKADTNFPIGFLNWFLGKQNIDIFSSIFHNRKIRLETSQSIPVTIEQEVIAKTPFSARVIPAALKIIAGRDILELGNVNTKLRNTDEIRK